MSDGNVVDNSARISTRKNKTNLTDCSMKNPSCSLNEVVCPNRHHRDVLMCNQSMSMLCLGGIIEESVAINTILTILEECMPEDILRIIVTVLPNKWNRHGVLMFERIRHNSSPIGTLEPRL